MIQALCELGEILSRSGGDIEIMTAQASRKLRDTLGAKDVHLVIFQDSRHIMAGEAVNGLELQDGLDRIAGRLLHLHNIEAVVPILLKDRLLGVVVLRPRVTGREYGPEDMRFLRAFAQQAALAIDRVLILQNVRHGHERTGLNMQELSDISHRLQTPLTVVKSELGSLKRRLDLPSEVHSFERSIDHISKFIQDLLKLSALSAGQEGLTGKEIDLSRLLTELVEYFQVMAGEEGIGLTTGIEPGLLILGSEKHLEELVMNLVSNAFKYQKRGGRRKVAVYLRGSATHVILEVQDNGIGIPAGEMGNIFERFYRSPQVSAGAVPGSGLGLAIAKKIAENHGGSISIESRVGKGTKVAVSLPLGKTG